MSTSTPDDVAKPVTFRRITALALPALVVLAAEPLYLLVDTAVVGHLGSVPLAALAIGGSVMTLVSWIGAILAYGTTGRVARRFGAGQRQMAVAEGVQGSWIAIFAGVVLIVLVNIFVTDICTALVGDSPESADVAVAAESWIRVAVFGAPFLLLGMAGQGWMRGVQDTKRPMRIVLIASAGSAILAPLLVYGAGMGLVGSAIANVTAQVVSGMLFIRAILVEKVPIRPDWKTLRRQLSLSRDLTIRGGALQLCFMSAAAVASRMGAVVLAAHQIGLQLWFFAALALDAVAIAAQALVGAELGAGSAAAGKRLGAKIGWMGLAYGSVFGVVILVFAPILPGLFSSDLAVFDAATMVWPWFIAMMPAAGVVFALDGVLIGAGDLGYMRNMTIVAALAGFLPLILATHYFELGLTGIWAGLSAFIGIRLIALLARQVSGKWAVVGAERAS